MKETKLTAKPRSGKGSASAGRLRRTGWFPAVVYGEGRPGVDIQLNEHDFLVMLRRHRSENMIVDLAVEGADKPFKVMLKAMQHHPVTGRVIHVDFYEISMTRKIEIELPVKLTGIPTGVANEGGILEHVLRALTVQCLPGDLIEEVELDVSGLTVGKTLRVRDVQIDAAKYRVLDDPDQVVAAVAAPRTEEEEKAEAEAEAAAAAAGPEVLTEKKEEEGEEGAEKGKESKAPAKEAKASAPEKADKKEKK
ncbi:MAG: 50S ribosomal protein L25 [Kiritimatiellae bacterium]|jgi:large subunit ribosomal protein L25|nr:50S ribosomal protein L25 [Kiritimatiellia bacterium]NLD88970.1 50S ribosomal protein L25 [Lentisphaerota bacterium]HOU21065.1 50S ribosomal protein L25 [Kiritimatiellia bacterium]HQN79688.1 50S ribosomal protein L25 [Kiritimatiellia bacterium]HQQ61670.1 50S ribosomal protein L25 [Kiritimatiellia bacterium]